MEGERGEVALAEAAEEAGAAVEADSAGNRPFSHQIMSFGGHGFPMAPGR